MWFEYKDKLAARIALAKLIVLNGWYKRLGNEPK
jgi:hypothetical protein